VLPTATERDIEGRARELFNTVVTIKNWSPPTNGIEYFRRKDEEGNHQREKDEFDRKLHGGVPVTTDRREADEAARGKAQLMAQLKAPTRQTHGTFLPLVV
jgi:hypothetical protein